MCNCLKTRSTGLTSGLTTAAAALPRFAFPSALAPAQRQRALRSALFEYVGATTLTVIGPASGRRYRFERPGARVAVDPNDGPALEAVPHLRRRGDERGA